MKEANVLFKGTVEFTIPLSHQDPPHVAIHISYPVEPVPVYDVSHTGEETFVGMTAHENTVITIPQPPEDIKPGDTLMLIKVVR